MSEPALREYTKHQIKMQQKGKPATELTQLSLGGSFFTGMPSIQAFTNIKRLDIIAMNPRLTTQDLESDPVATFPAVEHLDLNDNALESLPPHFAEMFPAVQSIELSNNALGKALSLEDPEAMVSAVLAPLKGCAQLKVLDLESNPVCQANGYRELVFRTLPSLYALDSKTQDGQEVEVGYMSDTSSDDAAAEESGEEFSSDFMEEDEEVSDDGASEGSDVEGEKPAKVMKVDA